MANLLPADDHLSSAPSEEALQAAAVAQEALEATWDENKSKLEPEAGPPQPVYDETTQQSFEVAE